MMLTTLKGTEMWESSRPSLLSAASFPSRTIASHCHYALILKIAMSIPKIDSVTQV